MKKGTSNETIYANHENFFIGSENGSTIDAANGTYADFKIFNKTLSPDQIHQLYTEENLGIENSTIRTQERYTDRREWVCEVTPNNGTNESITKNATAGKMPCGHSDNWNISNSTYYCYSGMDMYGNLTVESTGKITFASSSNYLFYPSQNGSQGIRIKSGGQLHTVGSTIGSSGDARMFFIVEEGGLINLTGGNIFSVGWSNNTNERGLEVNGTAHIQATIFGEPSNPNHIGLTLYSNNNLVESSHFAYNDQGILVMNGTNNTIKSVTFNATNVNIIYNATYDNEFQYCTIYSPDLYSFVHQNDSDQSVEYNYWGTTNQTIIQNYIYDFHDDSSLGEINYCSFYDDTYSHKEFRH